MVTLSAVTRAASASVGRSPTLAVTSLVSVVPLRPVTLLVVTVARTALVVTHTPVPRPMPMVVMYVTERTSLADRALEETAVTVAMAATVATMETVATVVGSLEAAAAAQAVVALLPPVVPLLPLAALLLPAAMVATVVAVSKSLGIIA